MNTAFADAFEAIQTTLGSAAAATLKRGRDTMQVMCASGVDGMRAVDETGRIVGKGATVRFKLANDFDKPIAEGDQVDLTRSGKTESMRVEARTDVVGLVRLTLIAEYE